MEYLVFIMGAIFGSFYNLITIRLPKGESIVLPPSHCTFCNKKLSFFDLIPIFSYIFLRGRCRYCKSKISKRYILTEIITAMIFLILYNKFAVSWNFIIYIILFSMLILSSIIDYYEFTVYDSIVIFFSALSLVILFISGTFGLYNIYGALVGFVFYFSIYFATKKVYGREVFGLGDVEILAYIGFIIGFRNVVNIGILAFYIGIFIYIIQSFAMKDRKQELAFVPALTISTFIVVIFNNFFTMIWSRFL